MIRIYLAVLAMISIPAMARAQDREPFGSGPAGPLLREDVAGSRQSPDAAPIGFDAGPVDVYPAMRVRVAGDSNVLGTPTNKQGDVFIGFEPEVAAAYRSANVSIAARANAAIARYAKLTSQNRNGFSAGTDLRYDWGARTTASAGASFTRAYERNLSVDAAAGSLSPARYDEVKGQAALTGEYGDVRATVAASLSRRDYAPVETVGGKEADQSFRDATTGTLGGRFELATSAGPTLIAETGVTWLDAIHPQRCCDRSSTTGRFLVGLRSDLIPLVRVEVLGGYLDRGYASAAFRDYSGLIWRARAEWYATPLITVALSSGRDLVSSGLPDVAGVQIDTTQLKIYYEARRDFDITLGFTHADEDYRDAGIAVRDNALALEWNYVFKPRRTAGGFMRWHDRKSNSNRLNTAGSAFESGLWFRLAI